MNTLPKQIKLSKKKFNQLKQLSKWYDDMPRSLEVVVSDSFHESVWEIRMELIDKVAIDDDRYGTSEVRLKKDRLYMVVHDTQDDDKEVLVELVSK